MYQIELWQSSSWQKDTRFYLLELCQDIFGNWIIKCTWGSAVKRDFGRSNSTICPDYQTGLLWSTVHLISNQVLAVDCLPQYEKQLVRRQKRGYVNLLK